MPTEDVTGEPEPLPTGEVIHPEEGKGFWATLRSAIVKAIGIAGENKCTVTVTITIDSDGKESAAISMVCATA